MAAWRSALVLVSALPGCVLGSTHVQTEVRAICTHDLPLSFAPDPRGALVAGFEVDGVGSTVAPDASAILADLSLVTTDDLGFAERLRLTIDAPALEALVIADLDVRGTRSPITGRGIDDANVAAYLSEEDVNVTVELTGQPAPEALNAEFRACLAVEGVVVDD